MRTILLAGPDGVGKSAVARELTGRAGPSCRVEHYWPLKAHAGAGQAPSGLPPRSMIMSVAKLGAVFSQNWAAELRSRLTGVARIIERGWWDQVVDPARYRLPPRAAAAARLLGRALPRPDLGILLVGDPDLIHARKSELEPEQIRRSIAAWQEIMPIVARSYLEIDVSRSVEDVVDIVISRMQS